MRGLCAIATVSCVAILSGCTGVPGTTATSTGTAGHTISGRVHGGQNPIQGARVYLLAVNSTSPAGPGIAPSSSNLSKSLLTSGAGSDSLGFYVTTDANGNFSITGNYTCPSAAAHPYIYASGGFPGSGTSNPAIALLAGVGSCNSSEFVTVNEVSTVVAAYAFAGFASDATHVSGSGSDLAATALNNAANTLVNLMNETTGTAYAATPAGNGTVPQSEIDTLANLLGACVNSTGSSSTQCTTLFGNAINGSTAPTDTATAAVNIAHNPGANIANLFALQAGSPPFQPMLSGAPNDFTVAVTYTGGGMNAPVPVAIDAAGDVWVGNTATGANSLSEFSPVGAPISGASGYTGGGIVDPYSIAIDSSGNVWTGNVTPNSISELSSTGTPISGASGYTGGGLNTPYAIAFDSSSNVWVVNNVGASLSEFSSTGVPITGSSGYSGGGIADPVGLAIDTSGNVWVTDSIVSGALSEFNSSGSPDSGSGGYTGGGLADPSGIAIDASGNLWVTNNKPGANSLSEFNSGGSPVSPSSGYSGGGLNVPEGMAIDGAGNIWVANRASENISPPYPPSSISEFNSSGAAVTGSNGYTGGLNLTLRLAIDGSGNLWVSNTSLNTLARRRTGAQLRSTGRRPPRRVGARQALRCRSRQGHRQGA